MPTDPPAVQVPDELRHLGEFRRVFATTAGAVALSIFRSIIPLLVGAGLIAAAEFWIAARNWKYYLALVFGVLFALQGVRLLVRTAFRLNQKVVLFDRGLAIWRGGRMTAYRWDQIDQVEASVAKAEGAASSFMEFSIRARTDDGEPRTYRFHPAGDPIPDLKGMWQVIDAAAGRGRTASAVAAVQAGEEVTFERTVWGTTVSTQIGVSLFGVRAKPRYGDARFLDWSRVERITVGPPTGTREPGYSAGGIPHLEVFERFHRTEPWVSELTSELPGYQALIEAAEFARQRYADADRELHRERLPAAEALIADGQEFRLGEFGVSKQGFRHAAESFAWDALGPLRFDPDAAVAEFMEKRAFPYGSLTLADRWLLQLVVLAAHYGDDDDEDEEDGEDEGAE